MWNVPHSPWYFIFKAKALAGRCLSFRAKKPQNTGKARFNAERSVFVVTNGNFIDQGKRS